MGAVGVEGEGGLIEAVCEIRHFVQELIFVKTGTDEAHVVVQKMDAFSQGRDEFFGINGAKEADIVEMVGTDRVMAGSDCGFGTFAGYGKIDPDIAFKKLHAMAEGAAIASQRLWARA